MRPFGPIALAAAMAALAACASSRMTPEQLSMDVEALATTMAAKPVTLPPPFISDFDAMRAALPDFDLERGTGKSAKYDISVVRDLLFTSDSSILSRSEVTRLEPLQAYLRTNPTISVRIEGYGDGVNTSEHNANLSLGRAQAVARALLTDMMIDNNIVAVGALMPQARRQSAEISFSRYDGAAW